MICPKCKLIWNVHGCELCFSCPACMAAERRATVLIQADVDHVCWCVPKILSESEMAARGAEGGGY